MARSESAKVIPTSFRSSTTIILTSLAVVACLTLYVAYWATHSSADYVLPLPQNLPQPVIPKDNPLTIAKVELGRHLFYDERLSIDESMSCGSCHIQNLAFTDGKAQSVGATGEVHPRGAMSLANIAYSSRLAWANPLLDRLEHQAALPVFGEEPVEMGMAGKKELILERFRADPETVARFEAAFSELNPVTIANTFAAISSFERTLLSFNSPYDRYTAGDLDALTPSQYQGMDLFLSERLECFHCHGGPTLSDSVQHDKQMVAEFAFHNTALHPIESLAVAKHPGIAEITRNERDVGRFKAPTLRNIVVTAPYMHDGSLPTLEAVLDHYENGGRSGDKHPTKSEFVSGFILTAAERQDLLNFFDALTDQEFLSNSAFADPEFAN